MKFKAKKKYGQSKINQCPFCERQATKKNEEGVDVCHKHVDSSLGDLRCVCKALLELRQGQYGAYFHCTNCGNMNMDKGLKRSTKIIQQQKVVNRPIQKSKPLVKKEITIRSDDPLYFD